MSSIIDMLYLSCVSHTHTQLFFFCAEDQPDPNAVKVRQLEEMGFDAKEARAALERSNWSVEVAAGVLLGGM